MSLEEFYKQRQKDREKIIDYHSMIHLQLLSVKSVLEAGNIPEALRILKLATDNLRIVKNKIWDEL